MVFNSYQFLVFFSDRGVGIFWYSQKDALHLAADGKLLLLYVLESPICIAYGCVNSCYLS